MRTPYYWIANSTPWDEKDRGMQIYLPHASFMKSAECLDNQRLMEQRPKIEGLITTLTGTSKTWLDHPIAWQWNGYPSALALFQSMVCFEIEKQRLLPNSVYARFFTPMYDYRNGWKRNTRSSYYSDIVDMDQIQYPPWLGDEAFHASHRSNLLRKDFKFYRQYGWTETDDLPYVWPEGDDERYTRSL